MIWVVECRGGNCERLIPTWWFSSLNVLHMSFFGSCMLRFKRVIKAIVAGTIGKWMTYGDVDVDGSIGNLVQTLHS